MHRREILRWAGVSLCAGALSRMAEAWGAERSERTGLGIAIYCLGLRRRQLQQRNPAHDLFEPLAFLEHCHQLGAGGIQASLGVRDAGYVKQLRQRAEQLAMYVEGNVSPPRDAADVDRFAAELRTAAAAGATIVRTVIMPGRRYEQFATAEQFRRAAEHGRKSLELAEPVAARHRVRLAVENHKDQRVPERLELFRRLNSQWIGACVDTGNSFTLLEDPLAVVEAYLPWACTVHLKDQAVRAYDDGFLFADVPLGQGFLDLRRMVEMLRKAHPEIRFVLETITRDPLRVPCLTERYWATLALVPGGDLARTLRTVRTHAAQALPTVAGLPLEKQAELEEHIVKEGLRYARRELGV